MIICIEGSRSFDDYDVFMRAMGVALSGAKPDSNVAIWVINSHKLNNFARSLFDIKESHFKSHKIKARVVPVTRHYAELRLADIDYFVYCCRKRDKVSSLVAEAELLDTEVGVFRS